MHLHYNTSKQTVHTEAQPMFIQIMYFMEHENPSTKYRLYLQSGQLVNVIFGANAPLIARTIEHELKNEELVKKGELQREKRAPHELTPKEQVCLPLNKFTTI